MYIYTVYAYMYIYIYTQYMHIYIYTNKHIHSSSLPLSVLFKTTIHFVSTLATLTECPAQGLSRNPSIRRSIHPSIHRSSHPYIEYYIVKKKQCLTNVNVLFFVTLIVCLLQKIAQLADYERPNFGDISECGAAATFSAKEFLTLKDCNLGQMAC